MSSIKTHFVHNRRAHGASAVKTAQKNTLALLPESTAFAAEVWYNGAKRREAVASETVLYADVLWLINFSMDFLSLYAAAKLLCLPQRPVRMVSAASLGAVYAVAAAYRNFGGFPGAAAAALVSAAMSALSFGIREGAASLLRAFLAVWGCGALLGGIMTVFCTFANAVPVSSSGPDLLLASALALAAAVRFAGRRMRRGTARIRFTYGGNIYEGNALVDSGNLLRDPLSGDAVILLRAADARLFAPGETDTVFRGIPGESGAGIRAVPVRTVGGTGMLYGFLCPEVSVTFRNRTKIRRAVICVDHGSDGYGGCGALLPASLCT